mgnify:CR=1 FL=1
MSTTDDTRATAAAGPVLSEGLGARLHSAEWFAAEVEKVRAEVARLPSWMLQTYSVPAWMANHATDL